MLNAAAVTKVVRTLAVINSAVMAGNVKRAKVDRAPIALTAVAAATPIARFNARDHRRVLTPATRAASGANVISRNRRPNSSCTSPMTTAIVVRPTTSRT